MSTGRRAPAPLPRGVDAGGAVARRRLRHAGARGDDGRRAGGGSQSRRAARGRRRRRRCSSIPTTRRRWPLPCSGCSTTPALRGVRGEPAHRASRQFTWDASAARLLEAYRAGDRGAGRDGDRPAADWRRRPRAAGRRDRRRPLPRRAAARGGRRGPTPRAARFVLYTPEPLTLALPPGTTETRVIGGGPRHVVGADAPAARRPRATAWTCSSRRPTPRRSAPAVPLALTIHDISFIAHPEWFRARRGAAPALADAPRGEPCAAVDLHRLASSRARELERHLRDRPLAHPGDSAGASPPRPPAPVTRAARAAGAVRRIAVQPPAAARPDRRVRRAHRRIPPGRRLVIVGDNRTLAAPGPRRLWRQRTASRRGPSFSATSRTTQLASLYARASVFAFLSEYEGFGLTPLEALAAGVPPVVLDTPVAREVYGDAAFYVPPGDIAGAARHLERLLIDPAAGAGRSLARAPAVLARYSWDDSRGAHAGARSRGSPAGDDACRLSSSASTRARDLERCLASLARRAARDRRTRSSSSTTPRPTAARRRSARLAGGAVIAQPAQHRVRRGEQRRHPRQPRRR